MAINAGLFLKALFCVKTTDSGEDEVYLLVSTRHSNGNKTSKRLPGNETHWSLNDGNGDENREKRDVTIHSEDLNVGESLVIAVTVMEDDGDDVGRYLQLAGEVAENINNSSDNPSETVNFAAAVAQIIGSLDLNGTDDLIGCYGVRLTNTGDPELAVEFFAKDSAKLEGVEQQGQDADEHLSRLFKLTGSGAEYRAYNYATQNGSRLLGK